MPRGQWVPLTNDEIAALQRRSDEVFSKFPDFVKNSFVYYTDYTKDGYVRINKALLGVEKMTLEIARHVRRLDYGISQFVVDEDILVFSGDNARHYSNWKPEDVKPIVLYKSTSVTRRNAEWYFNDVRERGGDPIIIEYRIPKGSKGIYIGDNTYHKRPEGEFLLGRNTRVRVLFKSVDQMVLEIVD